MQYHQSQRTEAPSKTSPKTTQALSNSTTRDQALLKEWRTTNQEVALPEVSLGDCPRLRDRSPLPVSSCHSPSRGCQSLASRTL